MKLLKLNPAPILFGLGAVLNMLVAWGLHLTPGFTALLTGGVAAVLTIITAATTRPIGLQAITGGFTALLTVLSPYAFHLSSDAIAKTGVVASMILAVVFHLAHEPVAAVRQRAAAGVPSPAGATAR